MSRDVEFEKRLVCDICGRDGAYDFMAEGDKGQFIYVSPAKGLVIVRNGITFGISSHDWVTLFYRFATEF